jgi:cystathionine beta-lyase/cystathionine gamma-synthase
LKIRCKKSQSNGLKVVEFLRNHPKIERVLFPLIPSTLTHMSGFTGMISFYLKSENFDSICDFARNLKLFKFGTSLGGVDSLLDHFGGTMRIYYTKEQQVERGYTDNFFRMSVGIEDSEDLIKDLEQALDKLEP